MNRIEWIFAQPFDMQDPDFVKAAQVLQREGMVKGVHILPNGQDRPADAYYVFPRALMERAEITGAVLKVTEVTKTFARDDKEVPMVSKAHARSRGFTEAEIESGLSPWIGKTREAAAQAIKDAEAALEQARADAAKFEQSLVATTEPGLDGLYRVDSNTPSELDALLTPKPAGEAQQ